MTDTVRDTDHRICRGKHGLEPLAVVLKATVVVIEASITARDQGTVLAKELISSADAEYQPSVQVETSATTIVFTGVAGNRLRDQSLKGCALGCLFFGLPLECGDPRLCFLVEQPQATALPFGEVQASPLPIQLLFQTRNLLVGPARSQADELKIELPSAGR